jgi:hypothetical protein
MNQAILNRARNDKFILVLDIPKILKQKFNSVLEKEYSADVIQFSCIGSPVPNISIEQIDVAFGSQVHKTSSNFRSYENLTVNFLVDNGWINYFTLFQWINLFNDQKTGIPEMNFNLVDIDQPKKNQTSLKDLVSTFTTYALDEFNNKLISFQYTNVFPVSLSKVELNYQDATQINSSVTFAFNQLHCDLIKDVNNKNC